MQTGTEYYLCWGIYLLAVAAAQVLLWRVLLVINNRSIKTVLQLTLLAILITPVSLESGQGYWVPAFMAAFMEGLNQGPDAALLRIWPILFLMLVFISLFFMWRLFQKMSKKKSH
jgi:hypothetical protein